MQEFDKEKPNKFGVAAGYAFVINSCIGAGFLAIPSVFQTGGWLLALVMTSTSLLLGGLFSLQLIEITSRANALNEYQKAGNEVKPVSLVTVTKVGLGLAKPSTERFLDMSEPSLSDTRQFDPSELVRLLLGNWLSYIYVVCICLYLAGALTAYANIFGTAFGTHAPILRSCDYNTLGTIAFDCRMQYLIFVSMFLVIMIYFTNIEFSEQLWMQAVMTVARVVVMLSIIILSLVSLGNQENINNNDSYRDGDPPLADWSKFGFMLPALLFGGIYQTQFAGILSAIQKEMTVLKPIVGYVTLTLEFFYITLGLTASFAVNHVASNASLSFGKYSNGDGENGRPIWTEIIGYGIVLFPAIDVMSIFPIVAHGISDNIMGLLGVTDRESFRRTQRLKYHGLRTICILPSFGYAFSETHLGTIVNNTGFFVFFLVLFMVPLMHIAARIRVPSASKYNCNFSPPVNSTQWLSLSIALVTIPLFVYSLYTVITASV